MNSKKGIFIASIWCDLARFGLICSDLVQFSCDLGRFEKGVLEWFYCVFISMSNV